ncbi:MAG: EAL domain-containing protein [Actinomycetota bacterium]|nr:EAL domain-containing protein [Actinomycetota bacterium]
MILGRGLTVAVALGLMGASVGAAAAVDVKEQRRVQDERAGEAARAASDLRSRFDLNLSGLSSVQGLFAASEEVTGPEFARFSEGLLRDSPFSATLLVSRIPDFSRSDYEASKGNSQIREPSRGRPRRASVREEYYPVSYRSSAMAQFGKRIPLGLDLAVDPVRGPALRAARDSGVPQATRPVVLRESGRRGLLVFLPIYTNDALTSTVAQRRASITGLAAIVFDAQQLGDSVREGRRAGTQIRILDEEAVVYGPTGELENTVTERIEAAGRMWNLQVQTPVSESMTFTAAVLGGGLLLSALATLLLLGFERRERYAQALSDRRLAERERAEGAQRTAEERFRRAFEDSGVGMALIGIAAGEAGRFLDVNQALSKLTGYPSERLLTMDLLALVHPDDRAGARATTRRLITGEESTRQSEQRLVGALGRSVWVLLSTSLVCDEQGEATHGILQVQDLSERKRHEGQLQHLADHDPLTGVFNRRRLEEELGRELADARRHDRRGAVLALDLDHFKYINDSLGHSLGDELIARVSGLISERVRETDLVARLGGDEFAVILLEADEQQAVEVADQLLSAIRSGASVTGPHGHVGTTASIGIAPFSGDIEDLTEEDLLAEADIAMYDAKESGRDRCCVYSTSGREARMAARMNWVERIRGALAEDRFVLHGQRIESLAGDSRHREELLLRMVGDDGDLIPPAAFLGVAERFDLIQEIDRWVVRQAIGLLARMQAAGDHVVLEVNLSAKSITDPDLPAIIKGLLEQHEVDPSRLVFEMTETAAIVNIERAKRFASFLHELGCEFALDDFGAGFASFYYLKHFTFDYLKIDGEFIEDLTASSTNRLLVRALVDIAHGLGKRTIAEFVEDEATLQLLKELGVDYVQGFHVARPAPIEEPIRTAPDRTAH